MKVRTESSGSSATPIAGSQLNVGTVSLNAEASLGEGLRNAAQGTRTTTDRRLPTGGSGRGGVTTTKTRRRR